MEDVTILELTKPELMMVKELLDHASVAVPMASVAASLVAKVEDSVLDFKPDPKAG